MNAKNNNKIIKTLIAVALLAMGQQTAIAADNDSIPAKKKAKPKIECCEDTTVTDHKDPYHKVVKEGGSMCEGMFTVSAEAVVSFLKLYSGEGKTCSD